MLGCYSKSKYKWLFFFHCFVVYVFPFPFINTACSKGFINLLSNLLRDLCNLEVEIMYEMGSVFFYFPHWNDHICWPQNLNTWPHGEIEYLKLRSFWKTWNVSLLNPDNLPSPLVIWVNGILGKLLLLLKRQNESWIATCRDFSDLVQNPV